MQHYEVRNVLHSAKVHVTRLCRTFRECTLAITGLSKLLAGDESQQIAHGYPEMRSPGARQCWSMPDLHVTWTLHIPNSHAVSTTPPLTTQAGHTCSSIDSCSGGSSDASGTPPGGGAVG